MKELDSVVLTSDMPEYGLKRGDLGTVVLVHHGDEGYEVEFVALDGEAVAVVSLFASSGAANRPARDRSRAPACPTGFSRNRPGCESEPLIDQVMTSVPM